MIARFRRDYTTVTWWDTFPPFCGSLLYDDIRRIEHFRFINRFLVGRPFSMAEFFPLVFTEVVKTSLFFLFLIIL